MARELKTNTATRITVGPFLDKTDGITPEVALTVTSEKLTLVVDDGGVPTLILDVAPTASGGANDMVHITNEDSGYYDLELAAANVNYLGRAVLSLNDVATHLPVFHEFMILTAAEYDRKYSTGHTVEDIYTAVVTNAAGTDIAADIIALKAETVAILTDTAVIGALGAGLTALADKTTLDLIHTDVDAVLADTTVIGSTGQGLTSLATQASVNTIDDFLDTEIAAILEDTAVIGALGAGLTALSTQVSVDAIKAETALIVADTNELQVDDYPTSIAAIKAETALIVADTNELQVDDYPTSIAAVKGDTAAILLDTGTDGVVVVAASKTGYALSDAGVDAVWDRASSLTLSFEALLTRCYQIVNNPLVITEATGAVALRNIADSADIASGVVADLGATTKRDGLTWV